MREDMAIEHTKVVHDWEIVSADPSVAYEQKTGDCDPDPGLFCRPEI